MPSRRLVVSGRQSDVLALRCAAGFVVPVQQAPKHWPSIERHVEWRPDV